MNQYQYNELMGSNFFSKLMKKKFNALVKMNPYYQINRLTFKGAKALRNNMRKRGIQMYGDCYAGEELYNDPQLMGTAFKNTIVGKFIRKTAKKIPLKQLAKVGKFVGGGIASLNPVGLAVGAGVLAAGGITYAIIKKKRANDRKRKAIAAQQAKDIQSTVMPAIDTVTNQQSVNPVISPAAQQIMSLAKSQVENTFSTSDTSASDNGANSDFENRGGTVPKSNVLTLAAFAAPLLFLL